VVVLRFAWRDFGGLVAKAVFGIGFGLWPRPIIKLKAVFGLA
jgi:hypothetical protein